MANQEYNTNAVATIELDNNEGVGTLIIQENEDGKFSVICEKANGETEDVFEGRPFDSKDEACEDIYSSYGGSADWNLNWLNI